MNQKIRKLLAHRGGNIALSFALLLVPLITAVGMSLDYVRAYNIRTKMQSNLDTALLAAVKSVGTLDDDAIEEQINNWFAAQTDESEAGYALGDIDIDTSNQEITATATLTVPTTLLKVANIDSIDVGVSTSVAGPGESYLNVYIVLDKSASMLLAATTAGQTTMLASAAGCAFACHTSEGATYTYKKKKYTTVYGLAKAMGVQLRTDVSLAAVEEVLDMIDTYDTTHQRIKVGLYTVGQTATQVLAPTFSTSDARKKLSDDTSGLTSATSEPATYFDYSMTALKKLVGTAGDGSSSGSPMKLVLMLTDGVQSERNWVLQTSSGIRFPTSSGSLQKADTPLNPNWCKDIKDLNASFGVLYTEYLPMTWDWGYEATVGSTMSSSVYASVWGGTIKSGYGSKTRLAYIPVALSDCASSSDLFIQANSSDEIEAGLSTLFHQYLNKVRLTN
ncbi:pilus assembly protein [Agrobacterium sp. a22-2]|uniref:TadE/TadG family type IV pilus assembly protein n=1 Tax=Agrobacterium sp. a22-2 TaxID=2283840 RepID=UPI00144539C8|nr:TadE/TadG family type IV pilus assembly protein [Agrobacterium sp. a22-2]NKN38016.1 pilus assembly protein [Agrobacterium sp. a22-2]